jgi:hypothetical protein
VDHGPAGHTKIDEHFQYWSGGFMLSQWNKFDMYVGLVFNVAPVLASLPFMQSSLVDELVYLLPTEEIAMGGDAGAIDVSLSLVTPIWAVIEEEGPL